MKRNVWSMAVRAAAVIALATGCGSEGSLANSGNGDWVFDGAGPRATSGGSPSTTPPPQGTGNSGNDDPRGTGTAGSNGSGGSSGSGGSNAPNGSGGSNAASGSNGSTAGSSSGSGNPSGYHQLANWTEPAANNPNHHGRIYFLGNAHKDENGAECTSCHGKNYEGDSGPACATCHSEWRSSCTFCHGTAGMLGGAPPRGVWDETSTASLAVGHHAAHLTAGSSHQAFACTTCHQVPQASDVDHTLGYQASKDLSTPGHHGDVVLTNALSGMTWNVSATTGMPATARGTCVGGCHSDGRGGAPAKTAYWAGGDWNSGCGNCHSARPNSGHHGHALGEGGSCEGCHAGTSSNAYSTASHLNGKIDYLTTVAGQGMTLTADPKCASGVRCNGTCHGNDEGHNNQCW